MSETKLPQETLVDKSSLSDSVVLQRLIAEVSAETLPIVAAPYNRTYNRHNR